MRKSWLPRIGKLAKVWSSLLPGTVVKLGQRYLIVHDHGEKARALLSASFTSLIEAGVRLVIANPAHNQLLEKTLSDPNFEKWEEQGRLVRVEAGSTNSNELKSKSSESTAQSAAGTVYVVALREGRLDTMSSSLWQGSRKLPNTTGMFLIEKDKLKRPQLAQFLQHNKDVQLVDLSAPKSHFSSSLNLSHARLHGHTILLAYITESNIEEATEQFLEETVSHGELCAVFTSKSSPLYKTVKEAKGVKVIAASSLASEPEEQSDGEIRIPDKELGLVTSIVSDLLENSKGMPVCFVFDSPWELIDGERWETIYSGIKQIVDLVATSKVTTLFLANRDHLESHFLGALRSMFQVQLKLDQEGLKLTKAPS